MKKYLFLLTLFLPNSVYAASPSPAASPCPQTDFGCIPDDPLGFAAKIYSIGLGFIGSIALVFIIYGGYLILTSQGDQLKLGKGKSYIVSAVIGLVMAIAGFAIYQIITVDVIKLPGFSR